jgi:hypothetical protein
MLAPTKVADTILAKANIVKELLIRGVQRREPKGKSA